MSETTYLKNQVLKYIETMPPLPTSVGKIMEICRNPNASPVDLNKVISLDPVLLARVMKLINSAYYGLSQEVTSLARAIILLGVNTVKNMAVSTAVLAAVKGRQDRKSILASESFWRHSLCVGVAAKLMARKRGLDPQVWESYFIAGLLHDIGKIPLNNHLPDYLLAALGEGESARISFWEAENRVNGISHTDFGSWIMESWKLGEEIRDVVQHHHTAAQYEGPHKDLVCSVAVADYFANLNEIGFAGNRFPRRPDPRIMESLGFSWDDWEKWESGIQSEIEKAKIFLNLAD